MTKRMTIVTFTPGYIVNSCAFSFIFDNCMCRKEINNKIKAIRRMSYGIPSDDYYAGKRFLGLECVTTKILCNFSVLHSFAFKKAFYKLFVISFCFHVLVDKIYQLVRVHCLLMTYIRLQRVIKQFNSI